MSVRAALILVLSCICAGCSSATAQTAGGRLQNWIARTETTAARQGPFILGQLKWRCQARSCVMRAPGPDPSLEACKALAAEVGRIESYGLSDSARNPERFLNSGELAACNAFARPNGT